MNPDTTARTGAPALAHVLGAASIGTFVRAPLVTIGSNATLRSATRAMLLHDVGTLAVVDGGGPVGMLSERDLARAVAAGADPDAALVGAWISCPPLSVHPDAHVAETAITMVHNGLRCLPVFGVHGERIGFVRLEEILLPVLHAEESPQERLPYMPPD